MPKDQDPLQPRRGRRLTTALFVVKASAKHVGKYSYENTVYLGAHELVTVTCPRHGDFRQEATTHANRGAGCQACAQEQRDAVFNAYASAYVIRAREKHGNRYNYEKVTYRGADAKVTIICRAHGEFQQRASDHLRGPGCCPLCGPVRPGDTVGWVARARDKHKGRFTYARAEYVGSRHPITITCRKHGDFQQEASSHLRGAGCLACNGVLPGDTVGWVARAREVHGDRFDYGEAVYLCSSEKVAITCRVHGAFWQNASNHLSGAGCPRCPRSLTSKGERAVARVLEAAGVVFEEQWSHPTLRLRRLLWVDFALVGQRVLVEFDGVQHSGPVRWPGTTWEVAQAAFADGQVRDAVKDAWAVANGWRMVRLTNVKTVEADLRAAGVIP